MKTDPILILFIAGAVGALIKEIFEDGAITLPFKKDGKLFLGFLGSMILGGFVGYVVDGSPLTAAMAGFTGFSVIKTLADGKLGIGSQESLSVEQRIRKIAVIKGVDPELAVRVAKCESSLNPNAKNTNTNGSIDRGLFQINNKWHPQVTDEQALDIEFATEFFCEAVKNNCLSWWSATQKCWTIDKK